MGSKHWMQRWWVLYLYSSFSCLTTNLPPLSRFMPDGLQKWYSTLPRTLQYPRGPWDCSLLVLVMSCLYFLEDLLSGLSKVYSSNIGLLLLVAILEFSSSHNNPPKPRFLFFLGNGGFGNCGEAFGTFSVRSHIRASFQLIETRSWRFGIHDATIKVANGSLSPTLYSEIIILWFLCSTLKEQENCRFFLELYKRRGWGEFLPIFTFRRKSQSLIQITRPEFNEA